MLVLFIGDDFNCDMVKDVVKRRYPEASVRMAVQWKVDHGEANLMHSVLAELDVLKPGLLVAFGSDKSNHTLLMHRADAAYQIVRSGAVVCIKHRDYYRVNTFFDLDSSPLV